MNQTYLKLKDIQTFLVMEDKGFQWKKWDSGQMLTSDTYREGYQPRYTLLCGEGILEISQAQLGQMLSGVYKNGKASILNETFRVKNNGKEGKEIRYFINPVYDKPKYQAPVEVHPNGSVEEFTEAMQKAATVGVVAPVEEIDDLPF